MSVVLQWDSEVFGCIERDTFRLNPLPRTEISVVGEGRFYSRTGDRRAPLTAHFQTWQTYPQQKSFWQWYHNDLWGGALPFRIELWLWDRWRTVRAHFIGNFTTRYQDEFLRLTAGTFEIERESIQPPPEFIEPGPERDAHCIPTRTRFLT